MYVLLHVGDPGYPRPPGLAKRREWIKYIAIYYDDVIVLFSMYVSTCDEGDTGDRGTRGLINCFVIHMYFLSWWLANH